MPNTTISSAAVNSDFSDIAAALTDSVAADGQTPITGNLLHAAGSSSAPGVSFENDPASGMFLDEVGVLGLGAGAGGIGMLLDSVAFQVSAATPATPGTGYVVGDTIVLAGGTGVIAAILTVASLSGSGVATATVLIGGNYSVLPNSPAAQASTSGAGSGATFTLTSAAAAQISALNGGSLWQSFGATPYMAGAMAEPNGLTLANYIGAANIAAAVVTSLPLPVPEGYVTPVSNTPIITSDSIAATSLFYTPLQGLWVTLHNGSSLIPFQLSAQIQLSLTTSQAANGIYDCFLYYNGGTPLFGTGPGWNAAGSGGNITAGSCARSTGTGGSALARFQGFWTNAQIITLTYNTGSGNNTVQVPVNQGIYVATIYIDATAGQTTYHRSWGQNRKCGISNVFNSQDLTLQIGDSTASWTYSTNAVRPSNNVPSVPWSSPIYNVGSGTPCNGATILCGLAQQNISAQYTQTYTSNAGSTASYQSGIGLNSTTAVFGTSPITQVVNNSSTIFNGSRLDQAPLLGINTFQCNENWVGGSNTALIKGTQTNMTMTLQYKA